MQLLWQKRFTCCASAHESVSTHFSSHVSVLLLPNNNWLALHVVTHQRFVGSAKYLTLDKIGHCFTQILVEARSGKVPYETGQIDTHKLVDGSPTQSVGQLAGSLHTKLSPYVVELHLLTHLLNVSSCANHPAGQGFLQSLPFAGS